MEVEDEPIVRAGAGGAATLHDELVAYVDAVAGALSEESRNGVWSEHSYARARSGAPSACVRVLLAARAPPDEPLDVVGEPRAPPPLPRDAPDDPEPEPDAPDAADDADAPDDWEDRIAAHAPSKAHARLARLAAQALNDARLVRLALGGGRAARREEARAAARRLRTALAPLWAWPGPPPLRPPAWLHAQLDSHLPAPLRPLYQDVLAELRRSVPRLADRLAAARLPRPALDPLAPDDEGRVRDAHAPGPWLAWVRCGCGREVGGGRWERRLRALLHTRVLHAPAPPAAPPDRWAAAVLHAAKQALADVVEDAGERAVIVGGAGAGAGMAAALAAGAGAGVRGALLVAPAPATAEGPRDLPDDVLHEVRVPVLAVCGGRAAGALAGGARRVLAVAGADALLRLPLRARRRHRLPQHALDAALVEEMVRWATELAEAPPQEEDDFAHLPALAPASPPAASAAPAAPPALASGSGRSVEIVEGRVVARVSGSTPLLLTPRRAGRPPRAAPPQPQPQPPHAPLAAADIMQLPIVFADDDPPALAFPGEAAAAAAAAEKPVTVTSGAARGGVRFTRVIVAKRGAAARGAAGRGVARRARLLRP